MPDWLRGASRCAVWSQPLKSPITDTAWAFGAHTAKYVRGVPSTAASGCAPSFSNRRRCVPSLKRCRSRSLSSDSSAIGRRCVMPIVEPDGLWATAYGLLPSLHPFFDGRLRQAISHTPYAPYASGAFHQIEHSAHRNVYPVGPVVELIAELVHAL